MWLADVRTSFGPVTRKVGMLELSRAPTSSEFDANDPFETHRVGTPEDGAHHSAVVWNDDAERRRIAVRLRSASTGEPVVDATADFPAYGTLRIAIFRKRDYVLDVSPPGEAERTLGIRRDFVDCNDSATHVAVRPDGSVRARVLSTALACDVDPEAERSPDGSGSGPPSTATGE